MSIVQHHYAMYYALCSALFKYWSHSNTATLKRALEIKQTISSVFWKGKLRHSNAPASHSKWQNLNAVPGCVAPTSILLTPKSSASQDPCPSSFKVSCAWSRDAVNTHLKMISWFYCYENPMDRGDWWAAVHGVAKSQTRLSDFTFAFHFHALEKEMATHSSVLAWRIPGTEEPVGLPSLGSHRVGHDWSDLAAAAVIN